MLQKQQPIKNMYSITNYDFDIDSIKNTYLTYIEKELDEIKNHNFENITIKDQIVLNRIQQYNPTLYIFISQVYPINQIKVKID